MDIKIPFNKIIDFNSNISEISKMSLEHDYILNEGVVLGNFYITGEYKSHELSVNKEPFSYTLPFTVELDSDIILDSIDFNIEDFSYSIIDNTKLNIEIEYSLKAEKNILNEFKRIDEDSIEEELNLIDEVLESKDRREEREEENSVIEEVILEDKETIEKEEKIVETKDIKENIEEDIGEELEREISMEDKNTIINNALSSEDTFVTYHMHIVKESETIEMISALYKVPKDIIEEYNPNLTYLAGDKVIIPTIDE